MFENKIVRGIHMSRYIASWANSGGTLKRNFLCGFPAFRVWLGTLEIDGAHLTKDEIQQICNYARNGKLELETSAKIFFEEYAKKHNITV